MSTTNPGDCPNSSWHATGRINWQVWHLKAEAAYRCFLDRLRECCEVYSVDLLSFVVMSNHYHLVARCPEEERFRELTGRRTCCRHFRRYPKSNYKSAVIAQFMHRLKLTVAKAVQEELGLSGHFWNGPHHRRLLRDEWALLVAVAYDHRNPVRKGMVSLPEQYERSSAAWWAGRSDTPILLARRSDFPFGISRELFREQLLNFQSSKRLDDVMEVFGRSRMRIDSVAGRAYLEKLMTEAGLEPLAVRQPCRTATTANRFTGTA